MSSPSNLITEPVCGLSRKLEIEIVEFVLRFTVPVACSVAPPPVNVIVGTSLYPLPLSLILTAASSPVVKSTCAVATAVVPPSASGALIVTVGVLVYPVPAKDNVTLPTVE